MPRRGALSICRTCRVEFEVKDGRAGQYCSLKCVVAPPAAKLPEAEWELLRRARVGIVPINRSPARAKLPKPNKPQRPPDGPVDPPSITREHVRVRDRVKARMIDRKRQQIVPGVYVPPSGSIAFGLLGQVHGRR